jgi:hypothetical protein
MTDNELLAIVEEHEALATSGDLNDARATAIDLYMGRPYGDEVVGRSQVVMRDVADTIEWIKPSLLKVFAAGDDIVTFAPEGPEDEAQAQQETDYCNYVLMQKNNGFMVMHDWFHDALLQKNGYVICSYEENESTEKESYKGLAPEEVSLLLQDGCEIIEATVNEDGLTDIKVKNSKYDGCVKIKNIPPERVLVSHSCSTVDLWEADFVEVVEITTVSKLREAGYDIPDGINDDTRSDYETVEERRTNGMYDTDEERTGDKATRPIHCRRVWIRVDQDGDGIAELRRMVIVGKTILENEEDDLIPVAAITAMRLPHEHIGMSVVDIVEDLQRIRTALTRGFLDNMYLANNGRFGVDANRVNLDDMLTSRPGGIVRVNGGLSDAIQPLVQPQNGAQIIQAIEYVDTVRENRTGVTKYNQGIDANSLNKTAHGITQIMNASQQRIELIARVFAESGVKSLMRIIQAVSIKNGRKPEMMKLRNQWVAVNPSEWKRRTDMSVSVGLGIGNKDQNLMHLQNIIAAQQQAFPLGVASPTNIYNALAKLTQNAGFKNVDDFWTDPQKAQPKTPQVPPEVQKAQMEMQADAQKFQAQTQNDIQKYQADAQQKELDRQAETARAMQLEQMKQQGETEREAMKLQAEQQMKLLEVAGQILGRQPVEQEVDTGPDANQEALMNVMQTVQQLAAVIASPKQIVRDATGAIIGAQHVGM